MSTPPWGHEPTPNDPFKKHEEPEQTGAFDPPPPSPYQPYGTPSPYGSPAPYGGYPLTPRTNGLAIASLVVSLVGAVGLCCYGLGGFVGVVGAILGHVSRKQIRERQEGGDGIALAGVIVGWIAFALAVIAVIAIVGLVVATDGFEDCYYDGDGDYVCT